MAPASAGNAANYEVDQVLAKGTRGKLEKKLGGGEFHGDLQYLNEYGNREPASGQTFPRGGVLTVSTAVAGAAGESLSGNHAFTITKGGKVIGAV